tara:strand:+ start:163 stop:372 length:210 start_codon:yes stop_codon:yes gene_type:complete
MKNIIKTITLTISLVSVSSISHGISFSSSPNFLGGWDYYGDINGSVTPNFLGGYDYHFYDNNFYGLWDY